MQARQEFTFNEARGFLFGKDICVWGQCQTNTSRSRRRNNSKSQAKNEFDSTSGDQNDNGELVSASAFDPKAAAAATAKVALPVTAPNFIEAAQFQGSKPGYYFSNGSQGLGCVCPLLVRCCRRRRRVCACCSTAAAAVVVVIVVVFSVVISVAQPQCTDGRYYVDK